MLPLAPLDTYQHEKGTGADWGSSPVPGRVSYAEQVLAK